LRATRLNIDTGACFGGELTAAAFTGKSVGPTFFVNSRGDIW
jgi:serine/threonine protein phosphatase 1